MDNLECQDSRSFGDMTLLQSMPSPHLYQSADIIYQAVMDDPTVSVVHSARLGHQHTPFFRLFLWVSSLVLGMELLP